MLRKKRKRITATKNRRSITIKELAREAAEVGMRLDIGAVPVDAPKVKPIRTLMWKASEYDYRDGSIDKGIVFAVKVLHAAGIETQQSCQGGEGHAYDHPTVDVRASSNDANGFAALAALRDYGIEVANVSLVWPVDRRSGLPFEKLWRVELCASLEDRADDWPMFEYCYRAYVPELTR